MKQRTGKQNKQSFTVEQVEAVVKDAPNRMDTERGKGLGVLGNIKRAKVVQSRRERARVESRYGKEHVKVQQADERMRHQHHQMVNARVEADRSQIEEMVERDKNLWTLHGYVRNQEGVPIPKATVALYPDKDGYKTALTEVVSNSKGYFTLSWPPSGKRERAPLEEMEVLASFAAEAVTKAEAKATLNTKRKEQQRRIEQEQEKETQADMQEALRNNVAAEKGSQYMLRHAARLAKEPVYLGAAYTGSQRMDGRSLYPAPGTVIYRDIELDLETSEGCQLRTRYLGNSSTCELHDLRNEKSNCKISRVRADHRVYFVSEDQAKVMGYDFCAKCYGKSRSKR